MMQRVFGCYWTPTDPVDIQESKAQDVMDEVVTNHPQVRRFDPAWLDVEDQSFGDTDWLENEVPWLCNFHSKKHCGYFDCNLEPYELRQLSHDITTALRHEANNMNLDVDAAGFADLDMVAARFDVSPYLVIHIARTAEKPRLQVFNAVHKDSVLALPKPIGGGLASASEEDLEIMRGMLARAIHGHSLPQVQPSRVYTPLSPEDYRALKMFVHGTDLKSFWHIMRTGLKPGGGAKGRN
jgi:hypothetical protein